MTWTHISELAERGDALHASLTDELPVVTIGYRGSDDLLVLNLGDLPSPRRLLDRIESHTPYNTARKEDPR
ncbi:hypothetical protein SCMU_19450 [Sinomonas cyclohexanicum]|uniref:Uncharacterized protein n=1 Tax=Sinomonas cyclohexanicum TaxID=322009 RepID=A0ABN6FJT0_SINCY|nr:hypothetical protein [Corynebacterium cyclohexanicum]BCT76103.1 hypothetical protein SCMU_19450 [Corynebacterium cyclohexanicum]